MSPKSLFLTPDQQAVLNALRKDPDAPGRTQPMAVTVAGVTDEARLEKAVCRFVDTADIFRLRVDLDAFADPAASAAPDGGAWLAEISDRFTDIEFLDFTDLPPDEQESELTWMILDEVEHGWDLAHDWPVRVNLVHLDTDRWAVVFLFHRLVYHRGAKQSYMAAFKKCLLESGGSFDSLTDPVFFWFEYLKKMYAGLGEPIKAGDGSDEPLYSESGIVNLDLSDAWKRLKLLCEKQMFSFKDILLTGMILWHHWFRPMALSGLWVDFSEAPDTVSRPIVGPVSRQGLVSTSVENDQPIAGLALGLKLQLEQAARQAKVPREFFLDRKQLGKQKGAQMLFQYHETKDLTSLENEIRVNGSRADTLYSEYDLELNFKVHACRMDLTMVFSQKRVGFDQADTWIHEIGLVLSRMANGLDRPVADLGQHLAADRIAGLKPANPPHPGPGIPGYAPKQGVCPPLSTLFSKMAAQFSDKTAVRTADQAVSYGDLDAMSDHIARSVFHHAGRGGRIGIFLDQGIPAIASILAVLKSGNTYVPLDVQMPTLRLQKMVDDAMLSLVILNTDSESAWQDLSKNRVPVLGLDRPEDFSIQKETMPSPAKIDSDAYILYTSGTTGTPKGVSQTQRNVLHFADTYTGYLGITWKDKLTLMSAFMFDAAVLDIFTALLNGAELVMFDLKKEDFSAVFRRLTENNVTIYHSTASVFRYFTESLDSALRFSEIRYVVLGGEPSFRKDLVSFKTHFTGDSLLVNLYGLSELTIGTMAFFSRQDDPETDKLPIGGPITSVKIEILDEAGFPTPGIGQMVFSGSCLAREYWQKPDQTKEKFKTRPGWEKQVAFFSGDMGEITPEGNLIHHGRQDFQIKIRGYRVEPGEIEAVVSAHEQVANCVVHPIFLIDREPVLAAFVIPVSAASVLTSDELIRFLSTCLPDYMIPKRIVPVSFIPKTSSGKIDRKMLEKMAHEHV